MIGVKPICEDCKHFFRKEPGYSCEAYPLGIHPDIIYGMTDHDKPLPLQGNDIVFEPIEEQ